MCLAVTCHLHFWQSEWDLLHVTVVPWGWNRYQNKSAQKADPGKEIIVLLVPSREAAPETI